MPKERGSANITRIKPFDKRKDVLRVIVETPKGSRNKYAFDHQLGVFRLKKVLPAGMSFPYDFGFIPRSEGEDGDPLDVLILMDEGAFPGCLLECRLIGIIEGEQKERSGKTERNDRLLAVETGNHSYAAIEHVKQLPEELVRAMSEFFVNYNRLEGKRFRVLGIRGPGAARRRIQRHRKAA